ncbi:Solute carrier family 23 member 2 [Lamellibrachia satsuma]|nr:Solute carrier family 23 member 2 [Lamellibrachia satsuma]
MGGLLAAPLVVASSLCISGDTLATGEVISTTFFVSGIATLLQSTFGSRLPIVQGGSFAFIAPILAILSQPEYSCKSDSLAGNGTLMNGTETMTWQGRMQVVVLGAAEYHQLGASPSSLIVLVGATGSTRQHPTSRQTAYLIRLRSRGEEEEPRPASISSSRNVLPHYSNMFAGYGRTQRSNLG